MIEIRNLKKKFGDVEVLKGIDITIEDGQIYGLVGVSGAGKSTLLRCINGLGRLTPGSSSSTGRTSRASAPRSSTRSGRTSG